MNENNNAEYLKINKKDPINPKYYCSESVEVIEVIESFKLNFCLGNAIKYILRAGKKGDKVEDLRKAKWYIQREIDNANE